MASIFGAAREGNEERVMELVDADPSLLERENVFGEIPLAMAAEEGHVGVVKLLIERGANIHATGPSGMTALHSAAQAGHVGVMRLLLQHTEGQGLDTRDGGGETALYYAAFTGQAEAVRFLLLAGADPTITENHGKTPCAHAQECVDEEEEGELKELYGKCVAVFQWWDGELERGAITCRARCLHKAHTTQRDMPTSQVPTYLEARVAAGHAVPGVEVVSPQSQEGKGQTGASGKRKATGESADVQGAEAEGEEETRDAVVEYVVKGLNEELFTELLEGFH